MKADREESIMTGELRVRRVYEPVQAEDGTRILADRLWPRGESKAKAALDQWAKEAAPSSQERKAFHDHQEDYETFRAHYLQELDRSDAARALKTEVLEKLKTGNVTLLYGSRDQDHNNARVLRDWILQPDK